ncbi:MAG: peptidylprolyl isomerase [Armatimonadota bacterium]
MSIIRMRKWMHGWFHYVVWALAIIFVVGFIGIAVGGGGSQSTNQADNPSGVIAKVNGEKIKSEVFEMSVQKESEMYEQMGQALGPFEQVQLRIGALDRLTNQKMMVQAAKKEKIRVSKKEIKDKIDEYVKQELDQYKNAFLANTKGAKTDEALNAELSKRQKGLTIDKIKKDITKSIDKDAVKDQLLVEKLQKSLESKVDTSKEALEKSYSEVKISQITVDTTKRSPSEAGARATELVQKIRSGEDFAKIAKENSDDSFAQRGGDRDFFMGRTYMEPELADAAFSLKPGEISDPIKMPQGYMIIKVAESRTQLPKDFNDPKKQKEYMDTYVSRERQKVESTFFEAVRKSTKIEIIDPELKAHTAAKDVFTAKNETEQKATALKAISAYKKALSGVNGESSATARIYSQMAVIYGMLAAPRMGSGSKQDETKYQQESKNALTEALNYTESSQLRLMLAKMNIDDKEYDKAVENLELVSDNAYADSPQVHMQIQMMAGEIKGSDKAAALVVKESKWMSDYEKQMKEQQAGMQKSAPSP